MQRLRMQLDPGRPPRQTRRRGAHRSAFVFGRDGFQGDRTNAEENGLRSKPCFGDDWIRTLGTQVDVVGKQAGSGGRLSISVMELDEMWHFVQKKRKNFGCGLHSIGSGRVPLLSLWDAGERRPAENYGGRRAKSPAAPIAPTIGGPTPDFFRRSAIESRRPKRTALKVSMPMRTLSGKISTENSVLFEVREDD